MNTLLLIIAAFALGLLLGLLAYHSRVITVSDIHYPGTARAAVMQSQDEVMRLKNEIAEKNVIKRKPLPNGTVKLTLKVIK